MKNNVLGKWRLVEMEQWDQEFIDLDGPGFISFQKGGRGEMRFGAVSLELDWEMNETGKVEFTFTGFDEGDETSGKGSATLSQGRLVGQIKFHQGDKSGFLAQRWNVAKT
jgi:hypothetical protein